MPAEVQRTKYSNRGSQPEPLAETVQQCLSLPASRVSTAVVTIAVTSSSVRRTRDSSPRTRASRSANVVATGWSPLLCCRSARYLFPGSQDHNNSPLGAAAVAVLAPVVDEHTA